MITLLVSLLFAGIPTTTRDYIVSLQGCYDGDTCTFDVSLPAAGEYRNDHGIVDYGLNVMLKPPIDAGSLWTLPLLTRRSQHVRMCDIDAPELHPGPNKKAIKARDDLLSWLHAAKDVVLRVPQDAQGDQYEKYGRLLGWIIADGENLNARQLQRGNAKPYTKCQP